MSGQVDFVGASGASFVYRLDAVIGRGRYGSVFEGTNTSSGRAVAIKSLAVDTSSDTRYLIDGTLIQRELEIMTRLQHSGGAHVIPLLDYAWSSQNGQEALLLVLPLAEHSLDQRIRDVGTLDESQGRELLLALASGMADVHENGVLHRDINPRNVLRIDGQWALSDFGISKDYRRGPATSTWEGTGTFEYWPIELFRGEEATPQSDMFAVGATVVEALTGRVLFPGPRHTDQRLSFDVALPNLVDRNFARVLASLLAHQPSSRPKHASDITRALSSIRPRTPAQRELETLLTVHQDETRRLEEQYAKWQTEQELRVTSMATLRHIWDSFVAHVRQIAPEAGETVQDDGGRQDFLRSIVINSDRLSIQAGTTLDPQVALLVGQVTYNNADRPGAACVANVVCRVSGADQISTWELTRYTSNPATSGEARTMPRNVKDEGVEINDLQQQLTEGAARPGATPLIETSNPLDSENLLALFVAVAQRKRG